MDTADTLGLRATRGPNDDKWFLREVDKGTAAASRGKFVEHVDIGKMIDERYPG
jgi:hypothetical protein